MELNRLQAALARLYTDSAARRALREDPAEFGGRTGLSGQEAEMLAGAVLADAERFARALARKRRGETSRAMPLTVQTLGDKFTAHFREYAALHSPGRERDPGQEALAFIEWLLKRRASMPLSPEQRDVLRYEAAWLVARRGGARLRILVVRPPGGKRRAVAIWFRLGASLRHWIL